MIILILQLLYLFISLYLILNALFRHFNELFHFLALNELVFLLECFTNCKIEYSDNRINLLVYFILILFQNSNFLSQIFKSFLGVLVLMTQNILLILLLIIFIYITKISHFILEIHHVISIYIYIINIIEIVYLD